MASVFGWRLRRKIASVYRDSGNAVGRDILLEHLGRLFENRGEELVEGVLGCLAEERIPGCDKLCILEQLGCWVAGDNGGVAGSKREDFRQKTTEESEAEELRGEMNIRDPLRCGPMCEMVLDGLGDFVFCNGKCRVAEKEHRTGGAGVDLSELLFLGDSLERGCGDTIADNFGGEGVGGAVHGHSDIVARGSWYALGVEGSEKRLPGECGLAACGEMVGSASRLGDVARNKLIAWWSRGVCADISVCEKRRYMACVKGVWVKGGGKQHTSEIVLEALESIRHYGCVEGEKRWKGYSAAAIGFVCGAFEAAAAAAQRVVECLEIREAKTGVDLDASLTIAKWKGDTEREEEVLRALRRLGGGVMGVYQNAENVHEKGIEMGVLRSVEELKDWWKGAALDWEKTRRAITAAAETEGVGVSVDVALEELGADETRKRGISVRDFAEMVWVRALEAEVSPEVFLTELKDMEETCSSGHWSRLANVLSGIDGMGAGVCVSVEGEMYAKIVHEMQKIIGDRGKLLEELAEDRSIEEKSPELKTVYRAVLGGAALEEMRKGYVENDGPLSPEQYSEAFRNALLRFEGKQ